MDINIMLYLFIILENSFNSNWYNLHFLIYMINYIK